MEMFAVLAVTVAILMGHRLHGRTPKGLSVEPYQTPYGVYVLKLLFVLGLAEILLGLIGIHLVHSPLSSVDRPDRATRAESIFIGLLFGASLYGLQRRLVLVWKFGWVILVAIFSVLLIGTLRSILETTSGSASTRWILSSTAMIAYSLGAVWAGRFWHGQKTYFSRKGL